MASSKPKHFNSILKNRWVFLSFVIVFISVFLLNYSLPLELFPKNDTYFDYTSDSDGNFEDGNSTTSIDSSNQHLTFEYTLGEENETPYARLIFHAHDLFRPINLNHFDNVEIVLHPEETNDFTLTLYTYVKNFSDPDNSNTHRPYSFICRPKEGVKKYNYQLNDFATPTWWFSQFGLGEEDIPNDKKKQITHLSFSGAARKTGELSKITIERFRFTKSLNRSLFFSISLSIGYLLVISLLVQFIQKNMQKRKNRDIKRRLYHPDQREVYTAEQKKMLLDYIAKNYHNPLLSLELISKDVGVNQFQVGEIISDQFKMRYKEYISHLRIAESKRLLSSTDTTIATISENVGYCYPNSFSRAFRTSEGLTPNQYRKQEQKGLE